MRVGISDTKLKDGGSLSDGERSRLSAGRTGVVDSWGNRSAVSGVMSCSTGACAGSGSGAGIEGGGMRGSRGSGRVGFGAARCKASMCQRVPWVSWRGKLTCSKSFAKASTRSSFARVSWSNWVFFLYLDYYGSIQHECCTLTAIRQRHKYPHSSPTFEQI